jgi:hypothetical protein
VFILRTLGIQDILLFMLGYCDLPFEGTVARGLAYHLLFAEKTGKALIIE